MASIMKEYGLTCGRHEETALVKRVNTLLASLGYRKLHKATQESLLEARLPFRYAHYYWQAMKVDPRWYVELYPNEDLDRALKFTSRPECGWILFTSMPMAERDTEDDHAATHALFEQLLDATACAHLLLHEYAPGEERL